MTRRRATVAHPDAAASGEVSPASAAPERRRGDARRRSAARSRDRRPTCGPARPRRPAAHRSCRRRGGRRPQRGSARRTRLPAVRARAPRRPRRSPAVFLATLAAKARAGNASGIPSKTLSRSFSAFFSSSQLRTTSSAPLTSTSPNTCGCREPELVVHRGGDVGESEPALLGSELAVEQHLEQEVAQLLLEVVVPRRRTPRRGRRWPRAPRRPPRAGGGAATRGSARDPTGTRRAAWRPARRSGPPRGRWARPARGCRSTSGDPARPDRARSTGSTAPTRRRGRGAGAPRPPRPAPTTGRARRRGPA